MGTRARARTAPSTRTPACPQPGVPISPPHAGNAAPWAPGLYFPVFLPLGTGVVLPPSLSAAQPRDPLFPQALEELSQLKVRNSPWCREPRQGEPLLANPHGVRAQGRCCLILGIAPACFLRTARVRGSQGWGGSSKRPKGSGGRVPARRSGAAQCTTGRSPAAAASPAARTARRERKENWIGGNWRYSRC